VKRNRWIEKVARSRALAPALRHELCPARRLVPEFELGFGKPSSLDEEDKSGGLIDT